MDRIFSVIAVLSNLGLCFTFYLGWSIGDATALSDQTREAVSTHFLTALASSTFAMLVHAIVLTYFMGTGRWIEETCEAYKLGGTARKENIRGKYRIIPGMIACILMIVVTGAFGAIADPGSNSDLPNAATIHFVLAVTTLLLNALVSYGEFQQIGRNGRVVAGIVTEVRRIRRERGLDVETVATA